MSRYKINDQYGLNFLTLTVVDWVDVFIRLGGTGGALLVQ